MASVTAMLDEVVERLKQSISSEDAAIFQATTFEDVQNVVQEIQMSQDKKKSRLNVRRRLDRSMRGLLEYQVVMEAQYKTTSYFAWIWVRDLDQVRNLS